MECSVCRPAPKKSAILTARRNLVTASLLVLLCFIVYHNSLYNGFVYDDYGTIVENKYISQPGRLLTSLFDQSYYQFAGLEESYRPVATLSYFLIYSVAKLNPFYYHLFSLILHTLNTILVYCLANLILRNRLHALIAGLLFACHPAASEAVNCIDFNDDLLATLFFLLALISYIQTNTEHLRSSIRGILVTLLFYFLGLLSKEMAIALPVVILLYDLVFREFGRGLPFFRQLLAILRARTSFYTGLMAVSLIYISLRFFILDNPGESLNVSFGSLFERIIYLPNHIFNFIRLAIYPANLSADYSFFYPNSFLEIENLMGVIVVLTVAGGSFWIYRHSKENFFGIWWFLISLFPVYNLIEIYHPFAERYLYLPIIGFCLVVPVVINNASQKGFGNSSIANLVTVASAVVILSMYSAATISRNYDWRDNFLLWSQTVQTSPNSLVARNGLGMAHLERGKLDEAAEQFKISINRYPGHHKSYYNLGLVYHQKGDSKKALEYLNQSVTLNPNYLRAHYNLATIYLQQQSWDLAIRHYVKVNEIDPEIVKAHFNLGMAYAAQGKLDPAVSEWKKVLQFDPHNTTAKNNIQKAKKILERNNN